MRNLIALIFLIVFCSTKQLASHHNFLIFKNSMIILTSKDVNDIINSRKNEDEKKDTIFHIKKRGKDEKIIKTCIGSDVLIVIDTYHSTLENPNFKIASSLKRERDSLDELLYAHKNYIGFNPYVLINNCIGFNYMRDVRKLHLIVNAPITIGFDACKITNVLQKKFHYEDQGELTFNKLNYQFGINLLFVPIMNRSVNFLIGPLYLFTSYNVTSTLYYNIPYHNTYVFKNNFEIKRHYYGISIGFLKRFDNRFNLTMLLTLGTKSDSYSKSDPFGAEYIKSIGGNYYSGSPDFLSLKSDVYANFMWTFGYRF